MTGVRVSTLLRWRFRTLARAARTAGWVQKLVAAMFLSIGTALVIAAYLGFHEGFTTLLSQPFAGPVLVRYVLELCFLTVFFLGTVSFVFASVPMLFRVRDAAFTAAVPVSPQVFFSYRFLGALVVSSWPILLIAFPAMIALGVVLGAGVSYVALATAVLVLFVIALGLTAALFSFAFAAIVRRLPGALLHFLEFAGFIALAVFGARSFVSRKIFLLLQAESPAAAVSATAALRHLFAGLPSHYPVEALVSVAQYEGGGGESALLVLAVGTVALAVVLALVVRAWYLPLLQRYREGTFVAGPEDAAKETMLRSPFPRVFRWKHGFLFEKDLLTFARSQEDMSRAGFLIALLVLYVLAVSGLSKLQAFSATGLFSLAVTFAFAATGYFALTFGMRFAFPALSLEGKSAWVLWSSPVHPHEFYSWKFFFWSFLVTVIMEAVSWAGAALFGLPSSIAVFLAFAVLCASVSVIAITLGQGSLFPDFKGRNADMLTTSPAGLAATAMGLGYLWVVARYVQAFAFGVLSGAGFDMLSAFGILIVSLTVVTAYWTLSRRRMARLEIV